MKITRSGCLTIIVTSVLLWAGILYLLGLAYPWCVEGEGFRGND